MTPTRTDILVEFADAEHLLSALRSARAAGLRRLETYSPFPLPQAEALLGYRTTPLAWMALVAAVLGGVGTLGMQYWMNGIDYPLNVGGRPLASWPAFIPAAIIVGVLAASATTLIGMLVLCGLPRLHHPVFGVPEFERASEDRFFLHITAEDPALRREGLALLLAPHMPLAIHEFADDR